MKTMPEIKKELLKIFLFFKICFIKGHNYKTHLYEKRKCINCGLESPYPDIE